MSRIAFHRPARIIPPSVPEHKVTLATPPQLPATNNSNWLFLLLPLLSSVSMAAYLVSTGRRWMFFLGISFVVVSFAVTFGVRWQIRNSNRKARMRQHDRYLEYLTDIRKQARTAATHQRFAGLFGHPSPERLWAIAAGRRRVWERRAKDEDFLRVRVGSGRGPAAMQVKKPNRSDPTAEYEPRSQKAADDLVEVHATVGAQPAWLDLGRAGVVSLLGPPERVRATAGALLTQLAVLHAPDDVRVALCADGEPSWEWAKWLPHTHDPDARGDAGVVPLVAERLDGLADYLEDYVSRVQQERADRAGRLAAVRDAAPRRRLVVVLDGYRPDADWARTPLVARLQEAAGPETGITLVCLVERENQEPSRVDVRARVDEQGGLSLEGPDPKLRSAIEGAVADRAEPRLYEQIARELAPLRLSGERDQVLSRTVSLPVMLGCADLAEYDPPDRWRTPGDEAILRMPIGVTGDGDDLVLDLKESAQGGIGPHGLVVGATGSGKSELLRTLVTGLTMQHPPELLGFVLVDFKGGATFAGVTELPHVAGLITNLADELALVDRMYAALHGELQRRQRLLRDAGNVDSLREYQQRQAAGGTDVHGRPLAPLPYLMIVVDEFGELLAQRPDFIELFVQIGRVGRSLGIHLLLATQRLEEGRLRGLESHLSYRICLRTFSAAESRAVLGTPDAYRLPSIPGSAYLKVDESVYERFRVASVSGPYRPPERDADRAARHPAPVEFGLRTPGQAREEEQPAEEEKAPTSLPPVAPGERSEMQVAVERIQPHGAPVHQVWLPPLPPGVSADMIVGPVAADADRGLQATTLPLGTLSFPVGVVDLPAQQEQRPLWLDLAGAHGHLALVGAPQTGKSTALRTALLSAMLTHTPEELRFYCVDHGGGGLAGLARAPHVGGVAGRHDEERTHRTLAEVHRLIGVRERLFARLGIGSLADLRRMRAEGALPDDVPAWDADAADVVLVVDNWGAVRAADDDAEAMLTDITTRGLGVGVHLMLTANRWAEVRTTMRDNIGGRLELMLNEPAESEISRQSARQLRTLVPGRGIVPPGMVFHVALPRTDGEPTTENLAKAQDALVAEIADAWPGAGAPPVRVLPETLTVAELTSASAAAPVTGVPIGLRESDLAPVGLDLSGGDPHVLVLGDSGSGKSSLLRTWMRGMTERASEWQIRFMLVDYRRSLLGTVPDPYIGAMASDADMTAAYVEQLAGKLKERLPPAQISAQDLQARNWWSGPELYLVVDDYDLVAGTGSRGPLVPLADYLTRAREIGFHLVIARRVSGIGRSLMSDPLMSRLRELGTAGLIMNGDPREGALIGDQRARRLPPGRGLFVRRGPGTDLVQTAFDEHEKA